MPVKIAIAGLRLALAAFRPSRNRPAGTAPIGHTELRMPVPKQPQRLITPDSNEPVVQWNGVSERLVAEVEKLGPLREPL